MINRPFKFSEPKKPSIKQAVIDYAVWIGFWAVIITMLIRAIPV